MKKLLLIFLMPYMYSCSPSYEIRNQIEIKDIGAKITLFSDDYGGATGGTNTKVYIEINKIKEEILTGYNIKKFHVEYDSLSQTVVVYHCGGSIFTSKNLFSYAKNDSEVAVEKTIRIQYITDDFSVKSSSSRFCGSSGFYTELQQDGIR